MTDSTSIVKMGVETVEDALLSSWMVVVTPCLTVKPHPEWSLVTEPSVYAVTLSCLLAIPDSAFPSFQAGIGLGTFPTPWFA